MCIACRIKTGHSNLVSCFGPKMRALANIPCQPSNPRAKTWHKIWMTGLNPNYDTIPMSSLQNSQNKCQQSSFTFDRRRHLILPFPPEHTFPTAAHLPHFQYTHLLLRSADWWRHNILLSIAWTIWIPNASCQWIIMWIIGTPIMHIDQLHND